MVSARWISYRLVGTHRHTTRPLPHSKRAYYNHGQRHVKESPCPEERRLRHRRRDDEVEGQHQVVEHYGLHTGSRPASSPGRRRVVDAWAEHGPAPRDRGPDDHPAREVRHRHAEIPAGLRIVKDPPEEPAVA